MYVTVVTLSCVLLAQAGADVPLVSVEPAENQASTAAPASEAADLVAAALTLPEGAAVTGESMTLLQALSSVRGTQGRLEVPHAYWRLTLAVAEYCSHFEENDRLHRIEVRPEDGMLLETAGASAAAELRMAELRMVSAQHDLAEAVKLPATASLPLPADRPIVGVYLTKFEEVRRARQLPDLARLIDRNLPIRRQVIEVRTSVVRASQDVLEAKYDAYHLGKADFNEVLLSLRQWGAQHRAFLGTVFNYNHDIADYALSVADPQMEERVVVAMLIRPSEEPAQIPIPEADSDQMGQPTDVRKPSAVRPADYNAPVRGKGVGEPDSTPSAGPLQPTGRKMPTLAPPRGAEEPGHTGEGLSATSSDGWEKSATVAPVPSPPADEAEPEGAESGQAAEGAETPNVPVPEGAESDEPEIAEPQIAEPPMTLVQPPNASDVTERTVRKAPLDEAEGGQAAFGLYPALLRAEPDLRPKYLTEQLHRVRTSPEVGGESITLQQYLATPSSTDRRKVIAAYWLAAERAAKYQVLTTQVSFFEELEPVAMQQRDEPLGAEAMLELRAAKAAAQADLLASRLNLLEAQFQLTRRAGRPLESSWLLPATIPHASHVKLKLDAQPKELAESWPVRRLAAAIPAFSKGLQERADAVARADDSRASAIEAYRAGRQPIAPVLASIARQTEETFTFLETLTQYNEAIADYALRVLPSTVRGEQLASSLVVIR